jgi:hypothetical protein
MVNEIIGVASHFNSSASSQAQNCPGVESDFQKIFQDIIDRKNLSQKTGKEFIKTLNENELAVVQKSKMLANKIILEKLSEEGAENLFVKQGDDRQYVDLNNDGITEIGEGKILVFPPPNSPKAVKDAWEETSKNMSFKEKMLVMGAFLAQNLTSRDSTDQPLTSKNMYGHSEQDFANLLDLIMENIKRPHNNTEPLHKKNNDLRISFLTDFKNNILALMDY